MARGIPLAAAAGLLLAALPSGTAGAWDGQGGGGPEIWVGPGDSIQEAVEHAPSGATIRIAAGDYEEAVCVENKGLTIIGSGSGEGGTRITWPEWQTQEDLVQIAADRDLQSAACWTAQDAADPESAEGLQDDVSGLFFLNPDSPVTVKHLSTENHPANGIAAWGVDGFYVSDTSGHAHDRYGILAADATNSRIVGNVETGLDRGTPEAPNSGTAGIGSTDSDNAQAHIVNNYIEGYNLGIFVRESRSGGIFGNTVTGNCVGINIFDDGTTEIPDATRAIPGGDWTIAGNRVIANNRFCLAGIGQVEASLRVSGTGITVVNADAVTIADNVIRDNAPSVPGQLDFPPGGLTLLSLPLFNTTDPLAAGPVTDVEVVRNSFLNNQPWDILVGWPPGTVFPTPAGPVPPPSVGPDLTFYGNSCAVSVIGEGGVTDPPVTVDCP